MAKVTVLLSTYNGQDFLREQIKSILSQQGVDIFLRVRDDGSQDATANLLKGYESLPNVSIDYGENIGWKRSFTRLMQECPIEHGAFYAFADQDDVWLEDKMVVAVRMLGETDTPSMYHSNVAIMDGDMNFLNNRFPSDFQPDQTFPTNYLDGWAIGATVVFNSAMLSLVQQHQPTVATNHDSMVHALANLFGRVVYDPEPHISYRRHESAATSFGGKANAARPTIRDRYRRYKRRPKLQFSNRAKELLMGYRQLMSPDQLNIMKRIADYRNNFGDKLFLLFSPRIKATGIRRTLQIKYRVLNNTL